MSSCGAGGSSVPDIQHDADHGDHSQRHEGQGIRGFRTQVDPDQFADQELNVRRGIVMAQPRPDLPMPFGAWAVTPPVPDTQAEPRQGGQRHGHKLPHSRLPPHPADAVEENPRRVEDEESDVKDVVHE